MTQKTPFAYLFINKNVKIPKSRDFPGFTQIPSRNPGTRFCRDFGLLLQLAPRFYGVFVVHLIAFFSVYYISDSLKKEEEEDGGNGGGHISMVL